MNAVRMMLLACGLALGFAPSLRAQTASALPAPPAAHMDMTLVSATVAKAAALPRIHALIVAHNGVPVVEQVFRGPKLDTPVNIKSASKSIVSALVGIAIDRGLLQNTDQPVVPLLGNRVPDTIDPMVRTITLDHLLSMRSGLEQTSGGANYGRWVSSPNWVRYALSRPFVDRPGGNMLYSTGNTHLLSAVLTDASGRNTWELARDWLGTPLRIAVPQWTRDPQGIYFGGNEMALSPRALLRFGEMYRNGGVVDGKQVVPAAWVQASWTPRTFDRGGQMYGYGWFITQAEGRAIYYGWGYGGQMLYIVPSLALTIVATSDHTTRSVDDGYRCNLHALVTEGFMPAVLRADPTLAPVSLVESSWTYPPLGGRRCSTAFPEDPA